jgi:hypothetical protein
MNYDTFRAAWDEALRNAGLLSSQDHPEETITLGNMERRYTLRVGMATAKRPEPFSSSMKLTWNWDALHSARTQTTEEDALTEFLGRKAAQDRQTDLPWLRVDVALAGGLDWDRPFLLPSQETWRAWVSEVMAPMEALLPAAGRKQPDGATTVLSWRGEPEAQVRCGPAGEIWLLGVELAAWQGINLPRQWDDPQRKPDEGPEKHLADLAQRWRNALEIWSKGLKMLLPAVKAVN